MAMVTVSAWSRSSVQRPACRCTAQRSVDIRPICAPPPKAHRQNYNRQMAGPRNVVSSGLSHSRRRGTVAEQAPAWPRNRHTVKCCTDHFAFLDHSGACAERARNREVHMDGMIGFAVKLHVERHTLRRSLMATGVLVTLILGGALLLHDRS